METQAAAETYFRAWRDEDWDALRGVLADDATFSGPLGTASNAEECLRGLQGIRGGMDDIVVERRWVDGDDAITWFALHPKGSEPVQTVNWSHVADGRISQIRVTFDPRPMLG